jgi:hypothetical protein
MLKHLLSGNNRNGAVLAELAIIAGIVAMLSYTALPAYQDMEAAARGCRIAADLRAIDSACTMAGIGGVKLTGDPGELVPEYLSTWPLAPTSGQRVRYPGAAADSLTAGGYAFSRINSVWRGTYNGRPLEALH